MKKIAIIVAAGKGLRLGETMPKQFLLLSGKPVLHWSIQRFYDLGAEIVVVLDASMADVWEQLAAQHNTPPHRCVHGGTERYHSVQNAVHLLSSEPAIVAIHDAARPNISAELIASLIDEAYHHRSAIPFIAPSDSVRIKNQQGYSILNRDEVMMIQTPQCFWLVDLKKAYQEPYQISFTDDASVMEEKLVEPLHFVVGEKLNFKITHPADWEMMQRIFKY